MALKEKTIEIPKEFGEFGSPIVLRALSFGKDCRLHDLVEQEGVKLGLPKPKKGESYPLNGFVNMWLLENMIVSAPFSFDRAGIEDLDPALGGWILSELSELVTPFQKKTP